MARSNLSVGALLAILLCVSIAAIDHSIIATALPIMGKEMNITQSGLQWVANSFTIAFASGLFVAGRLADRYGRKRILLIGLVVFLAAAAYTATATTALGVTIGRGLMGLGGTMLLPSTLAIISSQAAPSRKALAISLWSGVFGVGVALGPLLGGWLLDNYSWNSIFWINVPLLVLAIVLVAVLLREIKPDHKPAIRLFDGMLSAVSLSMVIASIIQVPNWGFWNAGTLLFLAIGLAAGLWFVFRQLRIHDPLLDVRLFRNRPAALAATVITLLFASFAGGLFLVAQYAELVSQFSALKTGVAFVPLAVGLVIGSLWSSILQANHGVKVALTAGTVVGALGMGILTLILDSNTSLWLISILMGLATIGLGAAFAASTSVITSALPKSQAGAASALNDATREVGGAFGVAVIGSLAAWQYSRMIADTLQTNIGSPFYEAIQGGLATMRAVPAGELAQETVTQATLAFVSGMRLALVVTTITIILLVIAVRKFMPSVAVKEQPATEKRWFAH